MILVGAIVRLSQTADSGVTVGAATVSIGAVVQFPLVRIILVTIPAVEIVAVAVGRVVHVPPVTVTTGAMVYPEPPLVIVAIVPAAFDTAVATVLLMIHVFPDLEYPLLQAQSHVPADV